MNYALILAGGLGSRFWPLSRKLEPKQFLGLCSDKPILAEVILRIKRLIKKENIYIATNRIYNKKIKNCLSSIGIPLRNILLEPGHKNTMAPIAVYSRLIYGLDKDAVIIVLPSDHYVRNNRKFIKTLKLGIDIARNNHIVTFGITPTRPDTGYGYIEIKSNSKLKTLNSKLYYGVEKFIEKPDFQKAKRLARDKRFYWNSGIFIFRAATVLKETRKFIPKVYEAIMQAKNKKDCARLWHHLPSISFDYAIMEKTDKTVVLPLDCGWSDVGSWLALTGLMKKNKDGNIFKGKCIDISSQNTFVWSDNRLIATLGLKDIIVVDTKDALLVCNKDRAQEVKKIVEYLKLKNLKVFL